MIGQFVQHVMENSRPAAIIISVALMLFAGFLMTRITKKLRLPNVTAYILTGILLGPYCLGMIPTGVIDGMDFLSDIALLSFVALLLSLSLFPAIEKSLRDRSNHFEVHLELKNKSDLSNFIATIRKLGMRIDDIEMNPAYANSGVSAYTVLFTISSQELKKYKKHSEIIEALSSIDYVAYIEETA